jgi:hypothetical protein
LLLIDNLAVRVRAEQTGQDGLKSADRHAAAAGNGDKFGE